MANYNEYWRQVDGEGYDFNFTGVERKYFIQAEDVMWDYAPLGFNTVTGMDYTETEQAFVQQSYNPPRVGSVYKKCLYRGCVLPNFCPGNILLTYVYRAT